MPRLTEQEQQEIVRYIEADKPLPDKYRFLLFDDKRAAAIETVRAAPAWTGMKLAFEFLVLTAARSGEVRQATERLVTAERGSRGDKGAEIIGEVSK